MTTPKRYSELNNREKANLGRTPLPTFEGLLFILIVYVLIRGTLLAVLVQKMIDNPVMLLVPAVPLGLFGIWWFYNREQLREVKERRKNLKPYVPQDPRGAPPHTRG